MAAIQKTMKKPDTINDLQIFFINKKVLFHGFTTDTY